MPWKLEGSRMMDAAVTFVLWFMAMCIAAILMITMQSSKTEPFVYYGYQPRAPKNPELEPLSPPKEP